MCLETVMIVRQLNSFPSLFSVFTLLILPLMRGVGISSLMSHFNSFCVVSGAIGILPLV